MKIFENEKVKRSVSVGAAVVSLALLGWVVARHTVLAEPNLGDLSKRRTVVDSKSGKVFDQYDIGEGSSWPWKNPESGENTLFPAEYCYWTKDGKAKLEPTAVLLNEFAGKSGETKCPDCGRRVVSHNPLPPNDLLIAAAKAAGKIPVDDK